MSGMIPILASIILSDDAVPQCSISMNIVVPQGAQPEHSGYRICQGMLSIPCRAQRVLQAKADRLAKQLEQQQDSLSSCNEALKQQHAQQLDALQMQLDEQSKLQVGQSFPHMGQSCSISANFHKA